MRNSYLETIARLEPDIAMIDPGAFYASAAVSLKRIADSLSAVEKIAKAEEAVEKLSDAIYGYCESSGNPIDKMQLMKAVGIYGSPRRVRP